MDDKLISVFSVFLWGEIFVEQMIQTHYTIWFIRGQNCACQINSHRFLGRGCIMHVVIDSEKGNISQLAYGT